MQKIIKEEKINIGKRIKALRNLLSISQAQLASATGMSKGTLVKMESGQGFTGDYLLNISHFFSMTLTEFTDYQQSLPNELELRNRIKEYHKKHKSLEYKILNVEPNLNVLIEFRLREDFLQQPHTVNEIVDYCKTEYNLSFKSSVVSQALINAIKSGIVKRSSIIGRNYQYQAIKEKKV